METPLSINIHNLNIKIESYCFEHAFDDHINSETLYSMLAPYRRIYAEVPDSEDKYHVMWFMFANMITYVVRLSK